MGERTQMLFRITDTNRHQVVYSELYHYQWGLGRIMPMDVLHLLVSAKVDEAVKHLINDTNYRDKDSVISAKMNLYKVLNSQTESATAIDTADGKDLQNIYLTMTKDWKQYLIHNEDDLFKCDNNDGWMIVDLKTNGMSYKTSAKLSFYQMLPNSQDNIDTLNEDEPEINDAWYKRAQDSSVKQCSFEQFIYFQDGLGANYANPEFIKAYRQMEKQFRISEAQIKFPKTNFVVPKYANTKYPSFKEFNRACQNQIVGRIEM